LDGAIFISASESKIKSSDNMDDSKKSRLKVLYLASWYPNKEHPVSGIFIKRHAHAVSKYCDVCVLYVHGSQHQKTPSTEFSDEEGIKTVRVYYKKSSFKKRTFKDVSGNFLNCIRSEFIIKNRLLKNELSKMSAEIF